MNMLLNSYYISLFAERFLEKRNKNQKREMILNVKELKKQNKVA